MDAFDYIVVGAGSAGCVVAAEGGRAVGVEYERGGQTHTARAKREVILSGGAYNSPHLLMLSGVGSGRELQANGINVIADRAVI